MDEVSGKVLGVVHGLLERLTQASNLTPDQLTEVHMATTALGYQIARMAYDPAGLAAIKSREVALAAHLSATAPSHPAARRWMDTWQGEPGGILTGVLEQHSVSDDPAALAAIRDFLVAFHSPMDPVVSAGTRSAYAGGRGDSQAEAADEIAVELTADTLEAWLHRSGKEPSTTRVIEVSRLMGGFSKATYIVKMQGSDRQKTIVIRKDSYGLPTGSSVTFEYPVLQDMARIGLPVPAPLWLEADTASFSTAFMAVAFEAGTPANQNVPTDAASRRKWAQSCGNVLGRLHRDTAQAGADIREVLAVEIDELAARMRDRERAPHPGLVIGLDWLRQHLDDLRGRPAVRVHGDFGFHNFLMRDDRILAVLDWEFSHLGDPVEDLTSIKPFMDQIDGWNDCYAAYQAVCGFGLNPAADRYFNVWREVRNMVACLGSLNSLLLPPVKDVPLTVSGTIYIPKFEIAILDAIAEASANHE